MRRALVSWTVVFALLFAAFGITIAALNSTVYSAGGFVAGYLEALARRDAAGASRFPGVLPTAEASTELLSDSALGGIDRVKLVRDVTGKDGIHTVSYEYTLGGERAESDYRVRGTGSFLGLFPTWKFDSSPLATVAVTVLHDNRFRANGVALSSLAEQGEAAGYLVFAPGRYSFDHRSSYLDADAVSVPVTEPGSVSSVQVNVQANAALVDQVDEELREYLDDCAAQEVLQPTGCPFGKTFENRVDNTPKWSIAEYPRVEIIPGERDGSWFMPESDGAAHLEVEVQSIYDGTLTQYDKDVSFRISYGIRIDESDRLTVEALFD